MRKILLHSAALIILAGMLGGHITELFDHWDHTMQTGRETDYTVVVLAASVGVVFAVGKRLLSPVIRWFIGANPVLIAAAPLAGFRISPDSLDTGPPPLSLSPLRI